MDKNKYRFLLLSIITLFMFSCYEDKGVYDYRTLNEITVDTSGIQTHFTLSQFDSLVIVPEIKFSKESISENNLEYKWIIYSDKFVNESSESKTISFDRNLRTVIKEKPQNENYAIILYITDKKTNTVYQTNYSVKVVASVVSGWMVLQTGANGESDLDYIATPNTVPGLTSVRRMRNVYSAMNGRKIMGKPNFVSTVRVNRSILNYVYVGTSEEFLQLSATDFSLLHSNLELFKSKPDKMFPQFVGHGPEVHHATILINNNRVHNINNQASQYWDVAFSKPLLSGNTLSGEVSLAPFVYFANNPAAFVNQVCAMYDTIGKRFVKVPFSSWEEAPILPFPTQLPTAKFDVNNIGKDLIFFEKGFDGDAFAVFKSGASKELYRMKFNTMVMLNYDPEQPNDEIYNLARAKYNLSALPEIDHALFYACGTRGNYFYYATDKKIYTYSYAGSKQAILINDPFPDDEHITGFKLYNPGVTFAPLNEVTGTILYVATWNGVEGKLYEFAINASSGTLNNKTEINGVVNKKAPLNTFTGFGKIVDMCAKVEGTN